MDLATSTPGWGETNIDPKAGFGDSGGMAYTLVVMAATGNTDEVSGFFHVNALTHVEIDIQNWHSFSLGLASFYSCHFTGKIINMF